LAEAVLFIIEELPLLRRFRNTGGTVRGVKKERSFAWSVARAF
jgi:hypothetical protein